MAFAVLTKPLPTHSGFSKLRLVNAAEILDALRVPANRLLT
jgi:hypothetical protein